MANRNFGLDLLRCAAIALVLFNHGFAGLVVPFNGDLLRGPLGLVVVANFVSIEWLFVLSGFLIGTMLIRTFEGDGTFLWKARSFWLRRWFRTLPNYYFFLVVNLALVVMGIAPGEFRWSYAVFAQNLAWAEQVPTFFIEAWSLALDEWFYLVAPLLVGLFGVLGGMQRRHAFLLATATLIVVPMIGRLMVPAPETIQGWDYNVRKVTILHLDATGWGVMAAVVSRWYPKLWSSSVSRKAALGGLTVLAGLWLLLGVAVLNGVKPGQVTGGPVAAWDGAEVFFAGWLHDGFPRLVNLLTITLLDLGTVLALPWITGIRTWGAAATSFVEHVSNYSYSIYLCHYPLIHILMAILGGHIVAPWTIALLVAVWLGSVLAVAAGVFHSFEKPVSDLRERFTRKVDARPFAESAPPP